MKVDDYERLTALQASRRALLKGAASTAALALASGGALTLTGGRARAQGNLRAEILQIPGVNMGSPTDADWQRVGEMCLAGTKETVAEGEFAGVELTFMGLNNQNLHNFLFRGFLKPWETYTGAKINWIDLAQADYNARLQQSIATDTIDFDILEMGAPFEGDVCAKGLTSEMPDWVADLIDMDDYVNYLKAPVGTWDGKTYRISIDGDCHTLQLPHRRLLRSLARRGLEGRGQRRRMGRAGDLAAGPDSDEVPQRQGAERPAALRLSRPAQELGRLRLLLPREPRDRLCQIPRRPGLALRAGDHEAAGQQPRLRARHPGRARHDRPTSPPTRSTPTPIPPPSAVPGRYRLDAFLVGRCRLQRQDQRQLGGRRRDRLLDPARLRRCLQQRHRRLGDPRDRPQLRAEHGLYRLGRLRDGPRRQRREEAEGRLVGRSASRRQGHLALDGGLSVRLPALSQFPLRLRANGKRPATTAPSSRTISARTSTATTTPMPRSSRASPASSSIIPSPRTSWPRSTPASSPRRRVPTTSPPPGRRSPTRSAATARSRSTRPRSA